MISDPMAEQVTSNQFSRFAHGLHETLTLAERDGWLYTTQRSDVSRMRDTDGDGEADLFEVVNDDWAISGDYHEYAFGSKFDKNGDIWVVLCLTGSFGSNVPYPGLVCAYHSQRKTCSDVQRRPVARRDRRESSGRHLLYRQPRPMEWNLWLKAPTPRKVLGSPGWLSMVRPGRERDRPPSGRAEERESHDDRSETDSELEPTAIFFPLQQDGKIRGRNRL